jgi:glycosyltransferase involved in cell wall biosynthesis
MGSESVPRPKFGGGQADAEVAGVRYPRVLIVGTNFDLVSGGGITLTNLFHGWPSARLAVAAYHSCEADPAPCGRQYLIGSDELRWRTPMGLVVPGTRQRSVPDRAVSPPAVSKTASGLASRPKAGPASLARQAVETSIEWLGGRDAVRSLVCSRGLLKWVRDVKPDLIYTQLASLGLIRLVTQLEERLSLPVAVHIMDDWPSVIYDRGLLAPRLRVATDRSFRALVTRSSATLAISRPMAEAYRQRYGREWDVFHNPVDIARWAAERRQDRLRIGTFRLVYAGRVGLGIESSIVDVCRAVQDLGRRGHAVRLDIFTPSAAAAEQLHLGSFSGVAIHEAVEDENMPATLAGADLLVLPYDFRGRAAEFACLSYPTKAPAYMATGVPTLVYAPREHALALDAREKGWAYVVDASGVDGVARGIQRLMADGSLRDQLVETAIATCESHHDARVVRERFRATLTRAAAFGGHAG